MRSLLKVANGFQIKHDKHGKSKQVYTMMLKRMNRLQNLATPKSQPCQITETRNYRFSMCAHLSFMRAMTSLCNKLTRQLTQSQNLAT
jgi:hypothetical protein